MIFVDRLKSFDFALRMGQEFPADECPHLSPIALHHSVILLLFLFVVIMRKPFDLNLFLEDAKVAAAKK